LLFGIIAVSLYTIIIYENGASTFSLLISIFGIFNLIMALILNEKHKKISQIIITISLIPIFFFVDKSIYSIILYLTMFVNIYAAYELNIFKMKLAYLVSSSIWLGFGFYLGSTEAILFDLTGFSSLLIFFYQNYIKPKYGIIK